MNRTKRHFTEGAFLFSTFMEFNKCWRSGKKSRLVIESNVNGFAFAFINFSAFLGYPETLHVAPPEKRNPESNVKGNLKRKQTRKPSVITLEQRGFRPRNDRRTMRLHQKHLRMILSPQLPLQLFRLQKTWVRVVILPTWTLTEIQPFFLYKWIDDVSVNVVDYPMSFLSLSTWNFLGPLLHA